MGFFHFRGEDINLDRLEPVLYIPSSSIYPSFYKECGIGDLYCDLRNERYFLGVSNVEGSLIWTGLFREGQCCVTLKRYDQSYLFKMISSQKWKRKFMIEVVE